MDNLIDKIKSYITPVPSKPKTRAQSLKELQAKTQKLEQLADYAEAEAKLLEKAKKAKTRIKAVRKTNIRPLYILAGLALLVIIIVVLAGSC